MRFISGVLAQDPDILSRRAVLLGGSSLLLTGRAPAQTALELEDFGKLARVIDGDSFVLGSGLKVRLANIFAPEIGQEYAKAASSALATLMEGRNIGLSYTGPKRDRYDRALAQVYTLQPDGSPDQWVQSEMVRLGYGRVRSYADTAWEIETLLEIESTARRAGRGLWQSDDFKVRAPAPNALAQHVDSFQIIEGLIISAAQVRGMTFLNFGSDYKTDFTVSISRRDRRKFEKAGIDLGDMEGRRVRVRGWVELYNGPVIWLDHPQAIEFIQSDVS
ncbi:thermonuclease family protein [Litorimonas haliclonae]|uniref:thermonuclease family protein n=1 Tax=Litorimonas haliclonae TaxID=2081977 RepID=UPI0039F0DF90